MKSSKCSSLFTATLLALPTLSLAQSSVPAFISYQGRVVDASGNNVGTGTPVNRTVIFRIWDNQSSTNTANLIYSEAQTVTVSEGEFSVLVGQGVANITQTYGYSETAKKLADISTAFNGSTRFLGVTVAATGSIALTDNEITPRQQIVSTPFAMRAKFAESIGTSSDLILNPLTGTASNYGLGWYGSGRLFGGTAVDGPVLYGKSGGALGANVSGSQRTALRWDAAGRVGIGATSIGSATNKLTLQGDMSSFPADQLTIRGNADNNKRLLLGYNTSANKASLQSYTSASGTGHLLLNPNGGNVGINKTSPGYALDVTGAIVASAYVYSNDIYADNIITAGSSIYSGSSVKARGAAGHTFSGGGDEDGGLFSPGDGTVTIKTNGTERLRVNSSGNLGIGTSGSRARLDVAGYSGTSPAMTAVRYLTNNGLFSYNSNVGAGGIGLSAYFSGYVAVPVLAVFSDERIKHIDRHSESAQDLKTLMGIEVTDYSYIDKVAQIATPQKKVIAQQVEKVFPQAVSQITDVVPDIYKKAALKDDWISLESDLKVGDRVRLITEERQGIFTVLEVSEGKFRTEFSAEADEVFVYGREVSDFRIVDYDAIAMLNVSATQQLHHDLDALREENKILRREMADMKQTLEARLIALEQSSSKDAALKTVSVKTVNTVK